jgi:hypothetical protein
MSVFESYFNKFTDTTTASSANIPTCKLKSDE